MKRYITSNNTATGFNNGLFCPGSDAVLNVTRVDISDGLGVEATFHKRMQITTDLLDDIVVRYGAYPLAGIIRLPSGGDFLATYPLTAPDSGFGIISNFNVQDLFITRVRSENANDSITGLTNTQFQYLTPFFFTKIIALNAAVIKVFDRDNPVGLQAGVDVTLAAFDELEGRFVYVEIVSGTIRLEYEMNASAPSERLF
jgi:hypothetical protein